MKDKRIMGCDARGFRFVAIVAVMTSCLGLPAESVAVEVALIRGWDPYVLLPVFNELNDNWSAYGNIPVTIDTSLRTVDSFTYQDLVDTQADVLFLSNPAGGERQYSPTEIDAVEQYVNEGHSIVGTYKVFQHSGTGITDNRGLAPIFGLRSDIAYCLLGDSAQQAFDILVPGELFQGLPDPYQSSGYAKAQTPDDDRTWDAEDLAGAEIVARTSDNRGVITWYETPSYHAVYVSEMVEYNGSVQDTQFLYNALTVPEPCGLVLLGMGVAALVGLARRQT